MYVHFYMFTNITLISDSNNKTIFSEISFKRFCFGCMLLAKVFCILGLIVFPLQNSLKEFFPSSCLV